MASAAGLYMLDADGEPEPEGYVAAAARNQAGIVLGQARSMVQRSPLLLDRLVPHGYAIGAVDLKAHSLMKSHPVEKVGPRVWRYHEPEG